jgi:hypothetical protein
VTPPDAVRVMADLAEEELGLVATGRIDQLPALYERRDAALAALPAAPSDADRQVLLRAHQVQMQVTALLERALGEAVSELSRLNHGRTAAHGYAQALKRP